MNTRRYKIFPNCNEAEPGKRRGADLYVCSEGVFYRRENDLSATCLAPTEDDIYDVPDIGKVRIDLTREAGQEITPVAENAKKSAAASKLQAFFGRFVSGENLDGIIDQRVRETLLCRGEGTRDESDFHITLVFNGADADAFNKKVAELYEKYDTEHDCEPDSATEGWSENFELETVVSLGVMNEIFAQAEDFGGFKAKSAIAIYDGVFFFSETSEAIFQGQAS